MTIFVSPRLLTDDGSELDLPGNFPSFEDWPQTLAQCVFTIEVDGIGSAAVTIDPDALDARLADLARALRQDQGR